ncbi:peptidyl-prolyl cis-trans isomerase-like 6 [Lingula anatina]|uniref:Peptidyl-prolyl cis-trans isomerase n=1 Tax=Lingula anatina TaxID=7574 RepID=A0A1S3KHF3_LINAN|nr:peptidyl-prolyl cis-trans isomerase-like 6 [Lingula anatina]|eukprot:XP_013421904.1 peptidyl-prolyl cis-trans isomerase-like 6 [Lingula anatina]
MPSMPVKLSVYGLLNDLTFHVSKCCAEDLYKKDPRTFNEPEIVGMLEFDWDMFIDEKRKELGGETWVFSDKAIAFGNNELIGGPIDFIEWARVHYNYEDFRAEALYEAITEQAYKGHLNARNRKYVYMDITIDEEPAGRLLIELFTDIVPKTCENFRALCTGEKGTSEKSEQKLHYESILFHRIVRNGWIQGGDIWKPCSGDGGESIYGDVFEDENFAVSHSKRGMVGMANKGRHTNGSQFYITLQPAKWMDTKYVAFGQVIEGTETLKKMEAEETMNERPMKEIKIAHCNEVTFEF